MCQDPLSREVWYLAEVLHEKDLVHQHVLGEVGIVPLSESPLIPHNMWVVVKIMAPFLGTLNMTCRIIIRTQKGTLILTTTHVWRWNPGPFQQVLGEHLRGRWWMHRASWPVCWAQAAGNLNQILLLNARTPNPKMLAP